MLHTIEKKGSVLTYENILRGWAMSKDKNTKTDAVNNIVSNELSIKEVVIFTAKCVALIVLVMFAAASLLFSLDSLIAKAAVLIIATLFIKVLLIVVWLKESESILRGIMSYLRLAANSKDKERQ